MYKPIMFCL